MSVEPKPRPIAEITFEQAEISFKEFLDGQGFGSELYWVFQEDVIIAPFGNIFVRTPIPEGNRERARECFEFGKRRDLGLGFCAFGILDRVACAYISLPKDELDSQYKLMLKSLKLSHTNPMREAKGISSFILWKIRRLAAKRSGVRWDQDVPSRKTFLPR